MAYDSRTDRAKVTWEKKTERKRRYNEKRNSEERWSGSRNAVRNFS